MTPVPPDKVLKDNSAPTIVISVGLAAFVVAVRLCLLGVGYGVSRTPVAGNIRLPAVLLSSGILNPIVFGAGCSFLWLSLRRLGIKDALGIVIALSLMPVTMLDSADLSVTLWGTSIASAGLYYLLAKKRIAAGTLVGLAAFLGIQTLAIQGCAIPYLKQQCEKRERIKLLLACTTFVMVFVVVRIFVEAGTLGAVQLGLKPAPVSLNQLFRILSFEAYGTLALTAFVMCLAYIILHPFWNTKVAAEIWWYLLGCGVSCVGALLLHPNAVFLTTNALFLLMISARLLPRKLHWCVLLIVAASPFFLMVSQMPHEATLYSRSSTVIEVRNRKLYVDPLQGPILFERARLAALKNARLEESVPVAHAGSAGTSQPGKTPMWLTAYYPIWSIGTTNGGTNNPMYPHELNWQGLTHVVHFNVGPDSTPPYWHPSSSHTAGAANTDSMEMFYAYSCRFNTSYMMIDSLKKYSRANNVKLLLSIGGIWGAQASAMDYITSDSARTQAFVNAAVAFASRYGYNGIEVDWEPPRSEQQMSTLTRILKRRMTTLLGSDAPLVLAACFDCAGAYSPDLFDSVAQYNFMMYDMHQPYNGISRGGPQDPLDVTGFNAPLFAPDEEKYPVLATWEYNYDGTRGGIPNVISPKKAIRMGFPPSKIGMGVPFYGYVYQGKSAPNEVRNGAWPQYLSYADCMKALRIGGTRYWEDKARVPWIAGRATADLGWIVKSGQEFYITYDDSASLKEKVHWAKQLGLGGVMVYELWAGWLSSESQGKKDPLLRSIVKYMEDE